MGKYQPNIKSPLGNYVPLPPTKGERRLTYLVMKHRTAILGNQMPYLDCEVECGCSRYYHHLLFKRKVGVKYTCPGNVCNGLNLKNGIRIR